MKDITRSQKLREWKETSRHSLPPIAHSHRVSIRRWLDKVLIRLEKTIAEHAEAVRQAPTESGKAQLAYFRTMRSVVRTLAKENEQRRGYGQVS